VDISEKVPIKKKKKKKKRVFPTKGMSRQGLGHGGKRGSVLGWIVEGGVTRDRNKNQEETRLRRGERIGVSTPHTS